jgi:hypothetical protein
MLAFPTENHNCVSILIAMKPSKRSSSGLKVRGPQAVAEAPGQKTTDSGSVQNESIRLSRLSRKEVENRRCKAYKYFI